MSGARESIVESSTSSRGDILVCPVVVVTCSMCIAFGLPLESLLRCPLPFHDLLVLRLLLIGPRFRVWRAEHRALSSGTEAQGGLPTTRCGWLSTTLWHLGLCLLRRALASAGVAGVPLYANQHSLIGYSARERTQGLVNPSPHWRRCPLCDPISAATGQHTGHGAEQESQGAFTSICA